MHRYRIIAWNWGIPNKILVSHINYFHNNFSNARDIVQKGVCWNLIFKWQLLFVEINELIAVNCQLLCCHSATLMWCFLHSYSRMR